MTLALVFDTETTGKANFKAPPTSPDQPGLVQLAAALYDLESHLLRASINLVVIPDKPVDPEAAAVHGITPEIIESCGVPYSVALPMFNNLMRRSDVLVAHNINFDLLVMSACYHRFGADVTDLRNKPRHCTMTTATNICKLPSSFGGKRYKWPKLIEAYCHLVHPDGFEGAHDAMVDVNACWEVYKALQNQSAFPEIPGKAA